MKVLSILYLPGCLIYVVITYPQRLAGEANVMNLKELSKDNGILKTI
jgi:hypothetical protein